ncbi:MAG: hypothetical protein HY927_05135 [Elusimicrobia bacterium]|nr:hypothetical protein [Elusimicrobiota bacterium]
MAEAPLSFAVLLRGPELPEQARCAGAVAAFRQVPFCDAARLARSAWGIMGEDMEKGEAEGLAAALEEAGAPAVALPQGLLEPPPAPGQAVGMEFDALGLRLLDKAGAPAEMRWDRVALVAAAGFKETTVKKLTVKEGPTLTQKAASMGLMMAGLPIRVGGKERVVEKTIEDVELLFFLDLFERRPPRRFRVDAREFDYSCLGPGMQPCSAENFRALVGLLAARAPRALRSRGSQVLLGRQPVNTMGYDSLADLERESRWRLTLEGLRDP